MKQLLFLLLFPAFAMAQYPGNAGQKITLGEQTTADGLLWRGRLADTANLLTNKLDTSVYIVLDTGTRAMWYYRASTTPKWTRLVDSLNNLQGTLSVAKGGTGSATQNFVDLTTTQSSIGGAKTFSSSVTALQVISKKDATTSGTDAQFISENRTGSSGQYAIYGTRLDNGSGAGFVPVAFGVIQTSGAGRTGDFIIAVSNTDNVNLSTHERMRIASDGNVGIGTSSPAVQFHTTGAVRFATFAGGGTTTIDVDNTGNLARTSSIELKKDVTPINYGLNQILQINPINFNWINEDKYGNENENGFIAEDVMNVIPNVVGSDAHGLFMDYTKLIPILTKAIQEQQALIKALEQRILTLENK